MSKVKRSKKSPKVEEKKMISELEKLTYSGVGSQNYEGIKVVEDQLKDPQELFEQLLKDNNLSLDFDVIEEGTAVPTPFGFIKLDKPTLVVRAKYV